MTASSSTSLLDAFVQSGWIVDLALALVAVEFLVLAVRRGIRDTSHALTIALALAPGACLLLALRAALAGDSGLWVWVWLGASLPLHGLDLIRRRLLG